MWTSLHESHFSNCVELLFWHHFLHCMVVRPSYLPRPWPPFFRHPATPLFLPNVIAVINVVISAKPPPQKQQHPAKCATYSTYSRKIQFNQPTLVRSELKSFYLKCRKRTSTMVSTFEAMLYARSAHCFRCSRKTIWAFWNVFSLISLALPELKTMWGDIEQSGRKK